MKATNLYEIGRGAPPPSSSPRGRTNLNRLHPTEPSWLSRDFAQSGSPPKLPTMVMAPSPALALSTWVNAEFVSGKIPPAPGIQMRPPCIPINPVNKGDSIKGLWQVGRKSPVSEESLAGAVAPVIDKQDLAQAISMIAEFAADQLPLMVFERSLYHRPCATWIRIDKENLYQLLLPMISNSSVLSGLNDRSIAELYNKVRFQQSLQLSHEDIIPKPHLIACKDGVYDVHRQRRHELTAEDHFFSCINISVSEIGQGSGTAFESFIENLSGGDQKVGQLFQEVLGVILSGYLPKVFFLFLGEHDTGKTQAANLIRLLLGESAVYSIDNPNKLSAQWTFGSLLGKRLCYCPDAAKVSITETTKAAIKQMTGGDLLEGNRKYIDPFMFINEAKLLFISNSPLCGGYEEALLSRLVTIPFRNSVTAEKQIPNLAQTLYQERGYIVGKAFSALRQLIHNNFVFTKADCGPSFIPSYGHAEDLIDEFTTDCCELVPEHRESTHALFHAYQRYCKECSLAGLTDSGIFGRELSARFPQLARTRNAGGAGTRGFIGIRLL